MAKWYRFLGVMVGIWLVQMVNSVDPTTIPSVNTTSGRLYGSLDELKTGKSVARFLGVRYASAQRFEVAVPAKALNKTVNATDYGKSCPQNVNIQVNSTSQMNEDCLFLNVFVPVINATATFAQLASSPMPVMVWIHGGGYTVGTASTESYDGSFIATEGNVIVVTVNYRLGILGFLSDGDSIRGNLGLMDQVQGLRWIKENIGSFGGNPQNVTLFGQSAGAASTALHMLSPSSQGLFHKVILESGTAVAQWSVTESIQKAKADSELVAQFFHCKDVELLKSCLKGKPFQEIISAQVNLTSKLTLAPMVDHDFLPDSPVKLMHDGNFSRTPVMIGVTKNEAAFWLFAVPGFHQGILKNSSDKGMDMKTFAAFVSNQISNKEVADLILFEYTDWKRPGDREAILQQFINYSSDMMFKAPAVLSAKSFVDHKLDTYMYCFDHWEHTNYFPNWTGAYHTAELPFVFGRTLSNYSSSSENDTEIVFTKKVIQWWTEFAKMGNPTPQGKDPLALSDFIWPKYLADQQQYAYLAPTVEAKARIRAKEMALWNEYIPGLEPSVPTTQTLTSSVMPSGTPGKVEADNEKGTVNALIAVTVLLCIAVVISSCMLFRFWRKTAVARGDPGPRTRLI